MISIIICSRYRHSLTIAQQNVAATIGVPYEIVAIDNSDGQYGICQAYNLGAQQSRYDILCFMHEDIEFKSLGWGNTVSDIFTDKTIGVIGVAGSKYQLGVPSGWWGVYEYIRMQVIQTTLAHPRSLDVVNPGDERLTDVAAVDGLWLCSRREVWQQHKFDDKTFQGFHFYDLDYCTQVFHHLRICVTFGVLIEHFSTGNINDAWLLAALDYQRKWRNQLPFGTVELTPNQLRSIKQRVLAEYTERVIQSKLSVSIAFAVLINMLATTNLSRESIGLVKRFWLKRILRKDLRSLYK